MNLILAQTILEVSENDSVETIRRQYKIKALKYHPDKNPSPTAADDFRNVNEAYNFLIAYSENTAHTKFNAEDVPVGTSYRDVLFSFLSVFLNHPQNSSSPSSHERMYSKQIFENKMRLIFSCLLNMCESKAVDYVQKLDIETIEKIIGLIKQYRDVFHFTDLFLEKIQTIVKSKYDKQNTESQYLILNPFLEDLFEDNLYRFTMNNRTFIVPLWHQELIYDNSGEEIVVQCYPVLPENVEIDSENNVVIELNISIEKAFNNSNFTVDLCDKTIVFDATQLRLISEKQKIILKNQGISKVNHEHVFDVSHKSDIILHIFLESHI